MPGRCSTRLRAAGIRASADLRNEKINYKVREHSLAKVPLLSSSASARPRKARSPWPVGSDERQVMMALEDAVARSLEKPYAGYASLTGGRAAIGMSKGAAQ